MVNRIRSVTVKEKEEGYYNLKETRVDKWVYTTNISVTDGIRPVAGVPFKTTLGTCEYSCKTDKYGRLALIIHKTEGMNIEVKAANAAGEYETAYLAQVGNESKNILLKRNFVQYKAHTLAHNPEPPHEKSQPKPIGYIIQSGDTLSEIAARYEVSVSELAENNGIKDPNKIYPGQQTVIYGKKGVDVPVVAPGHTDGDSVDGPLSPGGWIPDTTDGSDSSQAGTGGSASSPTETGGTASSGAGESYPVPPNDPGADNTGHPVDGPLSPGGWTPDTTGGTASSGAGESYPLPLYPDPTSGTGSTGHPTAGAGGQKSDSSQTTATPNKPINVPTVGSKNSGEPVASIGHDQRNVPWMEIAIRVAKQWKGRPAREIQRSDNYHEKIGYPNTQTLTGVSWCGSFANYCFKDSGLNFVKSALSQFPVESGLFVEIDEPAYRTLMVFRTYNHRSGKWIKPHGHVAFVYGKTASGSIATLGGNQGGTIKLAEYSATEPYNYDSKTFKVNVDLTFYKYFFLKEKIDLINNVLSIVNVDDVNAEWFNVRASNDKSAG
ncbi:TIGR02594 family protein [Salmonella enterica]|nr:TIGR02594 family protein [Salmonella enterica]